jgi:hypothetical protein
MVVVFLFLLASRVVLFDTVAFPLFRNLVDDRLKLRSGVPTFQNIRRYVRIYYT